MKRGATFHAKGGDANLYTCNDGTIQTNQHILKLGPGNNGKKLFTIQLRLSYQSPEWQTMLPPDDCTSVGNTCRKAADVWGIRCQPMRFTNEEAMCALVGPTVAGTFEKLRKEKARSGNTHINRDTLGAMTKESTQGSVAGTADLDDPLEAAFATFHRELERSLRATVGDGGAAVVAGAASSSIAHISETGVNICLMKLQSRRATEDGHPTYEESNAMRHSHTPVCKPPLDMVDSIQHDNEHKREISMKYSNEGAAHHGRTKKHKGVGGEAPRQYIIYQSCALHNKIPVAITVFLLRPYIR